MATPVIPLSRTEPAETCIERRRSVEKVSRRHRKQSHNDYIDLGLQLACTTCFDGCCAVQAIDMFFRLDFIPNMDKIVYIEGRSARYTSAPSFPSKASLDSQKPVELGKKNLYPRIKCVGHLVGLSCGVIRLHSSLVGGISTPALIYAHTAPISALSIS